MKSTQPYKRVALKNILYLTDFSWASAWALPFVREIAKEYGAKVTALHVAVPDTLTYMTPSSPSEMLAVQQDVALAEMKEVEKQLADLPKELVVVAANAVWSGVQTALEKEQVDLIVVGTHGRTGLPKLLLGSAAEEIFRSSNVPVMTVGPGAVAGERHAARWECVVFASDFSPESLAAAPHAISFAEENDAQLTLVHVIEMPKSRGEARNQSMTVAEAMHRLHDLVPAEAELWCRPETVVEHGEPAARILAVAAERKADLIVMGIRNRSHVTVTSHLRSSVPHSVVVHAACPVLTVRT